MIVTRDEEKREKFHIPDDQWAVVCDLCHDILPYPKMSLLIQQVRPWAADHGWAHEHGGADDPDPKTYATDYCPLCAAK